MNCILCILYICKFSGCMLLVAQNGNSLFKCKTLLHYTVGEYIIATTIKLKIIMLPSNHSFFSILR